MTDLNFTDAAPLTGARITSDGYLVADVRCARTGCQQYRASDLGMAGNDVVTVYRPEETVFAKDSLATFAGKPVTMGHPEMPVTAENWRQLAVGDIGTEIARDGEYVKVPLKLMDAAAIKAVQAGTRELSMGYTVGLELEDGLAPDGTPYQAKQVGHLRVNHLAIVGAARGGANLRIGDSAEPWGASPITINGKDIGMADTPMKTVVLGDKAAVTVPVADALAIEAFKDAAATATAKLVEDHKAALAAKDTEIATKDAEITGLKAKVLDAAALDKLVADRADLIGKAKAIASALVTDGKSPAEIKKAAVVAKNGAAMADKSEAYIDAMFDILAADAAKGTDPAAKALADGAGKPVVTDADTLYAKRLKDLSDAWKTPNKEVA